ncbi:hypothetical protein ACEYW6_06015 [Nostoc sp. UIC 10607]|uniref:hypothetical protein n=1 Tax=Nostoc sp. UIC 10607 TaxID=3045935 RepID=UPI0039A281C8
MSTTGYAYAIIQFHNISVKIVFYLKMTGDCRYYIKAITSSGIALTRQKAKVRYSVVRAVLSIYDYYAYQGVNH